jgi:dihydrofolate reductase
LEGLRDLLLFRSLLDLGLVDAVEVAVIPVLLGEGIPLLAAPFAETKLKLKSHRVYKTGIVGLEYGLQSPATPASRKAKLATGKRKSSR